MGLRIVLLVMLMSVASLKVVAQTPDHFQSWFDRFSQEAIAQGISASTIQRVLPLLSFDDSVIELDQKQPESQITLTQYLKNILNPIRIQKGRRLMDEHGALLSQISIRYGVPPSIIVALWGVESSYGSNMGDYEVINSLATLAYEGRRASFFQKELIEALRIIENEGIAPEMLKGSWAGAMGQCQFMPSTFRHYAVDYSGDGVRDIWNDERDIFASIANYLVAEGWQPGLAWGREVQVPRTIPSADLGLDNTRTIKDWAHYGVKTLSGRPLPANMGGVRASLIQPDGPRGRIFLVYDNFRVLMRWNKSTYFATGVGLLANQIEPIK